MMTLSASIRAFALLAFLALSGLVRPGLALPELALPELALPDLGMLAQSPTAASGVHDFDFAERSTLTCRLPDQGVVVDAIRFDPPLEKGAAPWDISLTMDGKDVPGWQVRVDKKGQCLFAAKGPLNALWPQKNYRLVLRRGKGAPRKGAYVLLSRGHRSLGRVKIQDGKLASLTMPPELPEKGRVLVILENASSDLPLHEIGCDLPSSWTKVALLGDGLRLLPSASRLVLDPPLRPGRSCVVYLDVEQKTKVADKGERLRFTPVYARSAWRFLRPPDPRGKRRVVRVVKPGQTTLTLSPLGLEELRPDALGKEVVLKADANYRFVEGSGVLTARANKERVKPRIRSDGRELVFSVKKAVKKRGQKRSWKILSIKVQILPEAFGILQLYLLDGKTWLTQPFAKLH